MGVIWKEQSDEIKALHDRVAKLERTLTGARRWSRDSAALGMEIKCGLIPSRLAPVYVALFR
jgi:hypothetical protein